MTITAKPATKPTARLRELFPSMDWPSGKLEGLVAAVSGMEAADDMKQLIGCCVPG